MNELTRHATMCRFGFLERLGYSREFCPCVHCQHERNLAAARELDAELERNTPRRGTPAPLPDEEKSL